MLSWFSRNSSKPSKTPLSHSDGQEQQLPQSTVPVSPIPENKPTSQDPTHHTVSQQAITGASPAPAATTEQQQPKSTFTAALNTPHDAVLAELQGHDPSVPMDATPSTSALGMQSIDTLPVAASDAPGSVATSSSPPPELLYDPFTGVTTGILSPTSTAKKNSEDLWVHLTRIRSLQADVARLHLTMEGVGLGESVMPHLRSTAPRAVGERLEDDENSDADGGSEAEMRREREFERSERRFDGRKDEIRQVMAKVCPLPPNPRRILFWLSRPGVCASLQLDELSQALAAFHMLDTSMFNTAAAASTVSSSTPVPRHPDLPRISLEASPRGREETFDSPASIREPLPIFEEPESRVDLAQPDAPSP